MNINNFNQLRDIVVPVRTQLSSSTENKSTFLFSPLNAGFSTTMGNAIRRTLLSSIAGPKVYAIQIDGVNHEYTTVPGMSIDIVEFTTTIQSLIFQIDSTSATVPFSFSGPAEITSNDINTPEGVTLLTKDVPICKLQNNCKISGAIHIQRGIGIVESETLDQMTNQENLITLNTDFSPIERVAISSKTIRVDMRNNCEELSIEVDTHGTITPEDAMQRACNIMISHFQCGLDKIELLNNTTQETDTVQTQKSNLEEKLHEKVFERIEFSYRASKHIKNMGINYVGELACKTEEDFLQRRACGISTVKEINSKLKEAYGITLGSVSSFTPQSDTMIH